MAIARPISSIDASGPARLAGQDPQQMQDARMSGTLDQDLTIEPLRLGQPAGLVMPDGHPQRLLDRDLRHQGRGLPVSVSMRLRGLEDEN